MPSITISDQEFGKAIALFIGLLSGCSFFPYRIVGSTFIPPRKVEIKISKKLLSGRPHFPKNAQGWPDTKLTGVYELTRDEILNAITLRLHGHHSYAIPDGIGRKYSGNRVSISGIPKRAVFRLQVVHQGETVRGQGQKFKPL